MPVRSFLAWNVKIFATVLSVEWSVLAGGSTLYLGIPTGDLRVVLVSLIPLVPAWSQGWYKRLLKCCSHLPSAPFHTHTEFSLSKIGYIPLPFSDHSRPWIRFWLLNFDTWAFRAALECISWPWLPRHGHVQFCVALRGHTLPSARLCWHPEWPPSHPFCTAGLSLFPTAPRLPQAAFPLCTHLAQVWGPSALFAHLSICLQSCWVHGVGTCLC